MITGVINLLKPPGMTSHDAVSFVRRTYSQKQVGHAGTLDPAAAGVLPVFLGRATRLVEYLANDDKQYRAELTFGQETDTGDDTGTITRTSDVIPTIATVRQSLVTFLGSSLQVPPMYSAIKIGGQKLYDLARQGITVERQPRPITIHSIQVLKMEGPKLLIDVSCSKGTYIRSLCADIGLRCGSVAVMTFLLRSGVGSFRLESAVSLEEISENPALAIIPADTALVKIPSIVLSHFDTARFLNGQKLNLQRPEPSLVKVYGADETFIGIGSVCSSLLVPEKVFPPQ